MTVSSRGECGGLPIRCIPDPPPERQFKALWRVGFDTSACGLWREPDASVDPFCSSPAAPWHRARPEVWARVAPSSSTKSLAGQRAQRGSA
eukprot:scaffold112621_cov41-Phaeocystis_antarctica.AAC.1